MKYLSIAACVSLAMVAEAGVINSPMTCFQTGYLNGWDGALNSVRSDYLMSGAYSFHDNGKEDRLWKFNYCRPTSDSSPVVAKTQLPTNDWDGVLNVGCGGINSGNAALIGATSYHDNGKEDRRWTFYCGTLDTGLSLTSCSWSGYVNGWDGVLNYQCPSNGVARSVYSFHDNGKEDRLWKFECCIMQELEPTTDAPTKSPTTTSTPTKSPTSTTTEVSTTEPPKSKGKGSNGSGGKGSGAKGSNNCPCPAGEEDEASMFANANLNVAASSFASNPIVAQYWKLVLGMFIGALIHYFAMKFSGKGKDYAYQPISTNPTTTYQSA